MSDEDALLAAVLADPEADAPRLVYADWLHEQGRAERAEFIRVQITLARAPADDPLRPELMRREDVLHEENGRRWLAELPALRGIYWLGYKRGFADGVEA